ncbi:glycosyl hydrolase family 28-related protein [Priestia aryabhattai]|uniref:glycosyl hydrolase family 28-related protein n=1 Tax=Priestia aryabhattai TaxID=412384 RepID=UPI003F89A0A1
MKRKKRLMSVLFLILTLTICYPISILFHRVYSGMTDSDDEPHNKGVESLPSGKNNKFNIEGFRTQDSNEILAEKKVVNVKDYGAKGDGITDDTQAINAALDSIITEGGTIFFPKGTYILSSQISKKPMGELKILGEESTIKFVLPQNTLNSQTVLRFNNVVNNILFQGITIDANRDASNPLMVHNNSADMSRVAIVEITDCKFINGLQTDNTPFQSGVYIRGAFDKVIVTRSTFKNMNSLKDNSPVSRGLHVAEDSDKDNYTRQVIVNDSLFEDIYNYTSIDSDGLSYSNKFDPSQYKEGTLIVKNTTFKNCKGRSIKSQVQSNIIVGNKFFRNKYDGKNEIDCQYAGAFISENNFNYDYYGVGVVFGGSVRSNIHKGFIINKNTVNVVNSIIDSVCAIDVTGPYTLNSIIVRDNKVEGTVKRFCSFRVSEVSGNNVTVIDNSAKTSNAFLKVWRYGTGQPILKGEFITNKEFGELKQIEIVNTSFVPFSFINNDNIALQK